MRVKTVDQLAEELGIARSTIYRWRADGWGIDDLYSEEQGGWDPEEVREWAKDMKRARRAVLRPSSESFEDDEGSAGSYHRQWKKARAVMATIQARKLQESVVERSEVERQWSMRITELATSMDSLATQLAPKLVGLTANEIRAELRKAFHEMRAHYSRQD